jgi:putative ABC transport system substrate-binding protein
MSPDVIVAPSTIVAQPLKEITSTIPIVFISSDPLGTKLVDSLARPGNNLTGFSLLATDLANKRLDLLKTLVPDLKRLGILWNPQGPAKLFEFRQLLATAQQNNIAVQSLRIFDPEPKLFAAFQAASAHGVQAMLVLDNPVTLAHRSEIIRLLNRYKLPAVHGSTSFVTSGGLLSYGPDPDEAYRRIAVIVDKVLKGASPASIPVEQPTRFRLSINQSAAATIGLRLPSQLVALADEIIEGAEVGISESK